MDVNLPHIGLYGAADDFDNELQAILQANNISIAQFNDELEKSDLSYNEFKNWMLEVERDYKIESLNGIFSRKEGGTTVGNALRAINPFKKKEGGTKVGNFLRNLFGGKTAQEKEREQAYNDYYNPNIDNNSSGGFFNNLLGNLFGKNPEPTYQEQPYSTLPQASKSNNASFTYVIGALAAVGIGYALYKAMNKEDKKPATK